MSREAQGTIGHTRVVIMGITGTIITITVTIPAFIIGRRGAYSRAREWVRAGRLEA